MSNDARGTSGGVAIIWNPAGVEVDEWIRSSCTISRRFRQIDTREKVMIIALYGPYIQGEKKDFFNNIITLRSQHTEKYWMIGGDFNM